jgi:transcriptional regulator with XRE-family HTH domain
MTPAALRATLKNIGWTAKALSNHLNITPQAVRQWMIGRNAVPDDVAAWLLRLVAWLDANPAPVAERRGRRKAA